MFKTDFGLIVLLVLVLAAVRPIRAGDNEQPPPRPLLTDKRTIEVSGRGEGGRPVNMTRMVIERRSAADPEADRQFVSTLEGLAAKVTLPTSGSHGWVEVPTHATPAQSVEHLKRVEAAIEASAFGVRQTYYSAKAATAEERQRAMDESRRAALLDVKRVATENAEVLGMTLGPAVHVGKVQTNDRPGSHPNDTAGHVSFVTVVFEMVPPPGK